MIKAFLLLCAHLVGVVVFSQPLLTPFEKTGGIESATYQQCIDYYHHLARQYSNIIVKQLQPTDAGLPLHLVVFSPTKQFNIAQWRAANKTIILINNGIHAGEPDGIDASMMLLRDAAMGKLKVPPNIMLAVIPVYNIGGALNRNSTTRVNQQGPLQYGFRGNAQNLDLNRDFTKCDSRNARVFAQLFAWLDPDVLVDNHVSDGADYQHVMTLLSTQHNKLGAPAGAFLHHTLEPALYAGMSKKGFDMTPYVNFDTGSPEKGWTAFYDPPRYSSGFAALFQTFAFMPETHMLKPFNQRVAATYALMQTMIETCGNMSDSIKSIRKQMKAAVARQRQFALAWQADTTYHENSPFMGYRHAYKTSGITGLPRLYYDRTQPFTKNIAYYNRFLPGRLVTAPAYYIIPQGWWAVTDLLKMNGVHMQRLPNDTTLLVEVYRVEKYKSSPTAYEKHHRNYDVETSTHQQRVFLRKGDYLVPVNQRANRYIVEMLEPTGDDSFFSWNFFDAILQQKEGYSDYRWEDVAFDYLQTNPGLQMQLAAKKAEDPAFAASAAAQLNFIYKNSPYYESAHMRYPVYRWNP